MYQLYTTAWKVESVMSGEVKGGLLGNWVSEALTPRHCIIPYLSLSSYFLQSLPLILPSPLSLITYTMPLLRAITSYPFHIFIPSALHVIVFTVLFPYYLFLPLHTSLFLIHFSCHLLNHL